ncbi:MAG: TlpA family protein disulfide reductase [Chloroflexi bacterium]|nr:TlpA family protein disulfide reductase [Chloroflexota bacterium]
MSPQNDVPLDEVSGIEERPQNRREWSGVARSLALPLLIVATIVGVLFYVERRRDGDGSADSGAYGTVELPETLNPTGTSPSSDLGRVAPDFLLQTPDGGELRLSDLRGKPLLVNFWASWCTPCREEMPRIVKAYDGGGGAFTVVAVDLQENARQVSDFARDFGMTFPVVIDRTGEVGRTWRIGGPVEGIPSSYFIDAGGVVRGRVFGPMSDEVLAENLRLAGVE